MNQTEQNVEINESEIVISLSFLDEDDKEDLIWPDIFREATKFENNMFCKLVKLPHVEWSERY